MTVAREFLVVIFGDKKTYAIRHYSTSCECFSVYIKGKFLI